MKNLFIVIIIFALIYACKKPNENCPKEFEISAYTFVNDSIYHIGDTISLNTNFSLWLAEKNSGDYYNLGSVKMDPGLRVIRIDTGSVESPYKTNEYIEIINCSSSEFEWIYFSNGSNYISLNFHQINDSLFLNVSIKLVKKGLFILEFGENFEDSDIYFDGKCTNTNFSFHTVLNPDFNNNIELLKQSPISYYSDWLYKYHSDKFYQRSSFAYKVE